MTPSASAVGQFMRHQANIQLEQNVIQRIDHDLAANISVDWLSCKRISCPVTPFRITPDPDCNGVRHMPYRDDADVVKVTADSFRQIPCCPLYLIRIGSAVAGEGVDFLGLGISRQEKPDHSN